MRYPQVKQTLRPAGGLLQMRRLPSGSFFARRGWPPHTLAGRGGVWDGSLRTGNRRIPLSGAGELARGGRGGHSVCDGAHWLKQRGCGVCGPVFSAQRTGGARRGHEGGGLLLHLRKNAGAGEHGAGDVFARPDRPAVGVPGVCGCGIPPADGPWAAAADRAGALRHGHSGPERLAARLLHLHRLCPAVSGHPGAGGLPAVDRRLPGLCGILRQL